MTFLTPLAFALLALIPPIIALYLLKLRRQDHLVSSTYLWQRFVRDVEANAPWQKLRRNLLLLLQILFLLLLILALARPATEASGVAGQMVVLILDTSASMAATDGGDNGLTRLEAAKTAARNLVTNLPDNARVTVLAAAGGEVETLASASQDRRQVVTAIAAAQASALSSDLEPALTLAEAIVVREPGAEIVLLSDGVVQAPERMSVPVRLVPVGQSGGNQAISALSVTPGPAGNSTLFIQVSNYDTQSSQRRLVIQVDGIAFTALDLTVPPGGHVEQSLENLPASTQIVEAGLTPAETDFLPLDDHAWTVVRTGGPVQATLITAGNFFLQTALTLLGSQQIGPNLDLTVISPADWQAGQVENKSQPSSQRPPRAEGPLWVGNPPKLQSSNLYIFDSSVPDALPPSNLLFIAPPTSIPNLFDVMGQVTAPIPKPAQADHVLLQNVDLSSTQILTSTVLSTTGWSQVIVAGEIQPTASPPPSHLPIPLLLAGEIEGRRIAVLAFSLQQSDLPLRPAFPILMANLLNYLAPGATILVPPALAPGEAVSVSIPAQVSDLHLITPSGAETALAVQSRRVNLPPLAQPGLYMLAFESTEGEANSTYFAVNFLNPTESAIAPQPELNLTPPPGSETVSAPLLPAQQEWWRPLALTALILLVLEWLVYQRSAVFRYWAMIRQRVS
jgi:Ca-activated chloride channel homolog